MKLVTDYTTLNDVLLCIRIQVLASLNFARDFLPAGMMKPEEIFYFLKDEVTYRNDPQGYELLQSMRTLFSSDNKHHIYGAGDCDCFTIAALACLLVKGYKDLNIILAGRSKGAAVHIYCRVGKFNFDLTMQDFDEVRKYPYIQVIPFTLPEKIVYLDYKK